MKPVTIALSLLLGATALDAAPTDPASAAWFGLPSPGPATLQPVDFQSLEIPRIPAPPTRDPAFQGDTLRRYVEDIVAFSEASRAAGDRLWGRLDGGPAQAQTVAYVADHLRRAGLKVVALRTRFVRADNVLDWRVRVLGDPAFGAGTEPVELHSAIPMAVVGPGQRADANAGLGPSGLAGRYSATAPIVYLGEGDAAMIAAADIKGKIAVVRFEASPAAFYSAVRAAPAALARAGAAGIVAIYDMPGNMQLRHLTCPPRLPCVTLGGEDGHFLLTAFSRAAAKGMQARLRIEMEVNYGPPQELDVPSLIAKVQGRDHHENLVISAHSDAYFSGANDNASGLAGLIAFAYHYGRARRPRHDIYLYVSPGHHDQTNGMGGIVDYDPAIVRTNIIALNLEHIGQAGVYRSTLRNTTDAYGWTASTYVPTNFDSQGREVSLWPNSPAIKAAWIKAALRYGFSSPATFTPNKGGGEPPAWTAAGGSMIQDVETSPFFHTSGDTVATVSAEAMQRALLTYADFIEQMDRSSRAAVKGQASIPEFQL